MPRRRNLFLPAPILNNEGTYMRKEWILAAATVLVTMSAALALLRWLAPQLLGMPVDLQLVQASKAVPPFFENVFREQDLASDNLLLQDPYTNIRFKPLLPADNTSGPHDILGFRNEAVPNVITSYSIHYTKLYDLRMR